MGGEIEREELKNALRHINRNYKLPRGVNVYVPGKNEELRKEFVRKRKWQVAESKVPFSIIVEIIYILFLLATACIAVMYWGIGFTLLGWRSSIQSIAVNKKDGDELYTGLGELGYDVWAECVNYLMIGNILFLASLLPMWFAGVMGRKTWLTLVIVMHAFFMLFEMIFIIVAFRYLPNECNMMIFKDALKEQMKWYGILAIHRDNHGHAAMDKLHSLQAALGCCGVESFRDYEKIFKTEDEAGFDSSWYPEKVEVREDYHNKDLAYYKKFGREIRQIPHSCCKPIWRHNIYCADDIFEIEKSGRPGTAEVAKFRLNHDGCVKVVKVMCDKLTYLLTWGTIYILLARIILFILILIFTGLIKRAIGFLTQTLFSLTEGRAGRRYARMATSPDDLNMDIIRHPNDRFDPKIFRWVDAQDTNKEIPRKIVPLSNLFTIGELDEPGSPEMRGLQERLNEKSGKPLYFGSEVLRRMTNQEVYDATDHSKGTKHKVRADEARDIAKNWVKMRHSPEVGAQIRGEIPEDLAPPPEMRFPPVKSIYEKEPRIFNEDIEQVEIPDHLSKIDRLVLAKQRETAKKYEWEDEIKVKKRKSKFSLPHVMSVRRKHTIREKKSKKKQAKYKWQTTVKSEAFEEAKKESPVVETPKAELTIVDETKPQKHTFLKRKHGEPPSKTPPAPPVQPAAEKKTAEPAAPQKAAQGVNLPSTEKTLPPEKSKAKAEDVKAESNPRAQLPEKKKTKDAPREDQIPPQSEKKKGKDAKRESIPREDQTPPQSEKKKGKDGKRESSPREDQTPQSEKKKGKDARRESSPDQPAPPEKKKAKVREEPEEREPVKPKTTGKKLKEKMSRKKSKKEEQASRGRTASVLSEDFEELPLKETPGHTDLSPHRNSRRFTILLDPTERANMTSTGRTKGLSNEELPTKGRGQGKNRGRAMSATQETTPPVSDRKQKTKKKIVDADREDEPGDSKLEKETGDSEDNKKLKKKGKRKKKSQGED